MLLTTHYMDEAARLCDRVAVVDHGKVIALGTPRELIASLGAEHVDRVRRREARRALDEAMLGALPRRREGGSRDGAGPAAHRARGPPGGAGAARAVGAGLEPTPLTTHHATLEDVFMALTGRRLRDG